MKISYNTYKILSTCLGETLIKISGFFSLFSNNKNIKFFSKRSYKNIKTLNTSQKKIWFYASSVGEAGVCEILIKEILSQNKNLNFHVSLMTDTGYEIAKENLSEYAALSYSPIDSVRNVKKTLNAVKPDLICFIETELWPNIIVQAAKRNIPIVVLNARLSNSSVNGYKKIQPVLKTVFDCIKEFNTASNLDKNNLLSLSLSKDKVKVTGNAKYDFKIDKNETEKIKKEYKNLFSLSDNDFVFVCGSTREGEEEIILKAYRNLKQNIKNLKLIIVPRHLTRLPEIENLVKNTSFKYSLRSKIKKDSDIIVVDTMGELKKIYTIADLVFIGGSLQKFGGQNILEPASLSKPVIFGPHMDDFKEISMLLLEEKGGYQVDANNIEDIIKKFVSDKNFRQLTGNKAYNAVLKNKGAAKKQIETLMQYL